LKATSLSGEANGYGDPVMEIGNAADFSCAFSATTGFKVRAPPVRTNQTPPHRIGPATVRCFFVRVVVRIWMPVTNLRPCVFSILVASLKWNCFRRLPATVLPGCCQADDAHKTSE
jgi:hypothetical protein